MTNIQKRIIVAIIIVVLQNCLVRSAIITEISQLGNPENYLTIEKLHNYLINDVLIIDVRDSQKLQSGIIQGVFCMSYQAKIFSSWMNKLIAKDRQFVLYGDKNSVLKATHQLLNLQYKNIVGVAVFTMEQWIEKGLPYYMPEFAHSIQHQSRTVLDVRMDHQWLSTGVADVQDVVTYTLQDAFNQPLNLDKNKKYIVHCRGGYRARMAYSWLKGHNYDIVLYNYQLQKIGKLKEFKMKKQQL